MHASILQVWSLSPDFSGAGSAAGGLIKDWPNQLGGQNKNETFLAGLFLLLGCGAMNAGIIFTPGNNPSGDVNVLFNTGVNSGLLVQGTLNQNPGVTVNFTSTQQLLAPSNGQARVSANPEGTPLTNLNISLASGLTYGDIILNPFIGGQCPTCNGSGSATITVNSVTSTGVVEAPSTFTLTNLGGNNFLTITTSGGEAITSRRSTHLVASMISASREFLVRS